MRSHWDKQGTIPTSPTPKFQKGCIRHENNDLPSHHHRDKLHALQKHPQPRGTKVFNLPG